jgi:hypothetical protein
LGVDRPILFDRMRASQGKLTLTHRGLSWLIK